MRVAHGLTAAVLLGILGVGCAALRPPPDDAVAASLRREQEEERARESAFAAALPGPSRAASPVERELWLDVERPASSPTATVRSGWVEVTGRAGTRENGVIDVVIVLDASGSTQYASGADVNGNGVVGVRKRTSRGCLCDPSFYSSDPGDTVLDAEREATRRLIERLDPRRTRIGLVSFSDLARLRAPLGSSRELLELVLDDLAGAFGAGPTNLAEATRLAVRMLRETGESPDAAPGSGGADPLRRLPDAPRARGGRCRGGAGGRPRGGLAGCASPPSLGIDEPRTRTCSRRWPCSRAASTCGSRRRVTWCRRCPSSTWREVAALADPEHHHRRAGARDPRPARWQLRRLGAAAARREPPARDRPRCRGRACAGRAGGDLRRQRGSPSAGAGPHPEGHRAAHPSSSSSSARCARRGSAAC